MHASKPSRCALEKKVQTAREHTAATKAERQRHHWTWLELSCCRHAPSQGRVPAEFILQHAPVGHDPWFRPGKLSHWLLCDPVLSAAWRPGPSHRARIPSQGRAAVRKTAYFAARLQPCTYGHTACRVSPPEAGRPTKGPTWAAGPFTRRAPLSINRCAEGVLS